METHEVPVFTRAQGRGSGQGLQGWEAPQGTPQTLALQGCTLKATWDEGSYFSNMHRTTALCVPRL